MICSSSKPVKDAQRMRIGCNQYCSALLTARLTFKAVMAFNIFPMIVLSWFTPCTINDRIRSREPDSQSFVLVLAKIPGFTLFA